MRLRKDYTTPLYTIPVNLSKVICQDFGKLLDKIVVKKNIVKIPNSQ